MALKSRNGTVQSSNFQPFCTAVHGNPLYPKDPVRDFHRPIAMNALKLASRRNSSRACPSLLVTLQKSTRPPQVRGPQVEVHWSED